MRGAKYELTFKKPSGELVIESGLVMESAQQRIKELLDEHYHFQYSPTKSTIYNLSTRPELANKMLSNFVKLKRVIRQPES